MVFCTNHGIDHLPQIKSDMFVTSPYCLELDCVMVPCDIRQCKRHGHRSVVSMWAVGICESQTTWLCSQPALIYRSLETWLMWTLRAMTNVTNDFYTNNWNLMKILFVLVLILAVQSSHKFAHAMTAELSWHVQNCDLAGLLFYI